MTDGESTLSYHVAHRIRKRSKAKKIRDSRTIFSDYSGNLLLRESEFLLEPIVSVCFFDRVEIGPLEVLHKGQGKHLALVKLADNRRNRSPAEGLGGAQSPLSGDEFITVSRDAKDHGLEKTARAHGQL
jgi:hypothetical protein